MKPHHDYWAYLEQWDSIIKDDFTINPYGVVHNFLGYLTFIPYIHVPKALFASVYLFACYKLLGYVDGEKKQSSLILLLILLFNPLYLVFGLYYGSNDIFVAGLTILSIIYLNEKNAKIAGILFAIAIAYKFYPGFILPFLIFRDKKLNKHFLFSFTISLFLIYLSGYFIWGSAVLEPFRIGIDRPSKSLSIFRFIRGEYHPLGFFGVQNADLYSIYLVLASFLLSIFLYLYYRLDFLLMALFSYVNVLLLFKVGHHQFYFLFLLMSIFIYVKNQDYLKRQKLLVLSNIAFWIWFFIIVIVYPLTGNYDDYPVIREIIGLPNFIVLSLFNLILIKTTLNKS